MNGFLLADPARLRHNPVSVLDVGAFNTRGGRFVRGQLDAGIQRMLTVPSGHDVTPSNLFLTRVERRVRADQPAAVVVAAAGPVNERGVEFTNNGLRIVRSEVIKVAHRHRPGIPVILANDALCGAAGILGLPAKRLIQFNGARASLFDADEIIVVMLGTGMGIARLVRVGDNWQVRPSELSHLWARRGSVDYVDERMRRMFGNSLELEHYVSGLGIVNIASALIAATPRGPAAAALLAQVPEHDKARFIAQQASSKDGHPLFLETMTRFREQLGYALSALGMMFVPIVVAGRPAVDNLAFLLEDARDGGGPLRQAMRSRSKLAEVAAAAPVYIVRNGPDEHDNELNLRGAGLIGASQLQRRN